MMKTVKALGATLILSVASAAYAHNGVQNKAVMAQMDAMSLIASNLKVLGDMAKGARDFDAEQAQAAATGIATQAARTPELFEPQEDDPKSEAKPEIWQNFADFTAKAKATEAAARKAATDVSSVETLRASLREIGGTCQACHKTYRE